MGYASWIADSRGEYEWAASGFEEALGLLREIGDRGALARMLCDLGLVERRRGRYQRASALLEESIALQRDLGERHGAALALSVLGQVASDLGENRAAEARYQESLTLFRELGDQHMVGHLLDKLGVVARWCGNRDRAAELCEQSLRVSREVGCKEGIADALMHLSGLAEQAGSHQEALALCVECLSLYRDLDEAWGLAEAMETAASVIVSCGPPEIAGHLFAAAEALRERGSLPLRPSHRTLYEKAIAAGRRRAGAEAFDAAWAEGHTRPLEELFQEIRQVAQPAAGPGLQPPPATADPLESLSRREREVVELIARGLSNREIAEALVIGERTAEAHVTHILTKLGLHSRTQIAVWATQHATL